MATLKKYDLAAKAKGEVEIEDSLLTMDANSQMVKDYLVALRANQRQWSASTQTRAEVSHSKKKPFNQKGTGNARQGFLGAPHFRGGGRVHAPRPKYDQHTRINRREKRRAIAFLLSKKIGETKAHVLEYKALKEPKTKMLATLLKGLNLEGKRVLFVGAMGDEDHTTLIKSLGNLPKVSFISAVNVSGYDLAVPQDIIILDSALEQVKQILEGGKKKA